MSLPPPITPLILLIWLVHPAPIKLQFPETVFEIPPAIEDKVPEFVCPVPICIHPLPLILPSTVSFSSGVIVPIPTLPVLITRILSEPAVVIAKVSLATNPILVLESPIWFIFCVIPILSSSCTINRLDPPA